MKTPIFTGTATALVTPFKPDGSINLEKYAELIDMQIEGGVNAVVAVGTTGENATLSGDEHRALMKCAVDTVHKRVPVICSTGSNDTAYCIETSLAAKEYGADALLLVTPYYNKTSQSGLIKHYVMILEKVQLPAILYHIPGRTGLTVSVETFSELSKHPLVYGIKEASGNMSYIMKLISACGDSLPLYSGNDDLIIPTMSAGGLGVISVLSNIMPAQVTKITDMCLKNDFESARKLALEYLPLTNALFSDVNPIPVKKAMNLMGMDVGECRPPLFGMSENAADMLKNELLKLHLCKA